MRLFSSALSSSPSTFLLHPLFPSQQQLQTTSLALSRSVADRDAHGHALATATSQGPSHTTCWCFTWWDVQLGAHHTIRALRAGPRQQRHQGGWWGQARQHRTSEWPGLWGTGASAAPEGAFLWSLLVTFQLPSSPHPAGLYFSLCGGRKTGK